MVGRRCPDPAVPLGTMNLMRVRVSDTVTRYLVTAHLGPQSQLLLVRPDDGLIITGWRSRSEPVHIAGEWVSPYADLIAVVRGEDLDAGASVVGLGSPAAAEDEVEGPTLVA
jgi:hypothetical protein